MLYMGVALYLQWQQQKNCTFSPGMPVRSLQGLNNLALSLIMCQNFVVESETELELCRHE